MSKIEIPHVGTCHFAGSDEDAEKIRTVIDGRHQAILQICKEKGWPADPDELSMEQLLEVRKDQRWIDAGISGKKVEIHIGTKESG